MRYPAKMDRAAWGNFPGCLAELTNRFTEFYSRVDFRHTVHFPTMSYETDNRPEAQFPVAHSIVYREFQAEKEEILRHKWIESEKVGYDIGFERALVDWVTRHRAAWRRGRQSRVLPN